MFIKKIFSHRWFLAPSDHFMAILFYLIGYTIILINSGWGWFVMLKEKDWVPDVIISKYSV